MVFLSFFFPNYHDNPDQLIVTRSKKKPISRTVFPRFDTKEICFERKTTLGGIAVPILTVAIIAWLTELLGTERGSTTTTTTTRR